jgi:hypothetical protein
MILLFLLIWNLTVQGTKHNCKLKAQRHTLITYVNWDKHCRKDVNNDNTYCQHTLKVCWTLTEMSMRNNCFAGKTTSVFKLMGTKGSVYENYNVQPHFIFLSMALRYLFSFIHLFIFHLSIYKLKLMDIEMVPYKRISIVPVNYSSPY